MKKIWMICGALLMAVIASAQQPGDTIVVSAFKYGSTSRDTLLSFPSGNLTFERIIMKYNMRCKNALVSTQSAPDQGCGEWDYSCNTFIVDSARIQEVNTTHPSHIITNFTGTVFPYTSVSLFDYARYTQIGVLLDSILAESQYLIGTGSALCPELLRTDEHAVKSQVLYTAAELTAAGFSAGNIDGFFVDVANSGGEAKFFKVGMRHTQLAVMNPKTIVLDGFTNVYNHHFSFTTGLNRIQFHTPFVWDGISNLLIEFSFTNTVPGSPVVLHGHGTAFSMLLTSGNYYALDLSSSGLVNINTTHFGGIDNEITVGFWVYGHPDQLPANTSILYGYAGVAGQRHLNLHLPWANENIYFDCGYAGGYDRIFKAATPSEYEGQWNHWTFTKNATSGTMHIYLNGILWHSGAGMTKPMTLLNLMLGNNNTLTNNFKGRIRELTIWEKALSVNEIQAWMRSPIDSTHPSWPDLVAYYPADEGAGVSLADIRNNVVSSGSNLQWSFDRGDKLNTLFTSASTRPNIVLLRGNYQLTPVSGYAMDSVERLPSEVKAYSIIPAPPGAVQHDQVNLDTTFFLYHAAPLKIMDGEADTLLSTIAVVPEDSVQITTLNYLRRFPWYNEIMSFVTPYGKGLDLGYYGKTWYFDVTDFTPLLKGNKRMMMTGGVWQEELDIDFLFIVGTPARDVIGFNQLWQGSARDGQASIAAINNDSRFAPVNVTLDQGGDHFRLRATITGHGSDGEFHQNGGAVDHYFRVDSTMNSFSWQITEECAFNPVFPQGGTWVYDRQGWCPGQVSLTKMLDLTPVLTPGTSAVLDYHCSPPQKPAGDYRYLTAFQLVTYGPPNHNLDAFLVEIKTPSDQVLHSRKNPVCSNPEIIVMNAGAATLTSIGIEYWLNNASAKQSHSWAGSLGAMDTMHITLPTGSLWSNDFLSSGNVFHARIISTNGIADDYLHNNHSSAPFAVTDKIAGKFVVEVRTNNYPSQNSYRITDEAGNVLPGASDLSSANTIYRDTFDLDGCYTLFFEDSGHDGLSWWANSAQGTGYARLKNINGSIIKTFQPDFGGGFQYSFTTSGLTDVPESESNNEITIYPNPASGTITITGPGVEFSNIAVTDLMGRQIDVPVSPGTGFAQIQVSRLSRGTYLVVISDGDTRTTRKVVIE
ncbi:MAG: LamG-like jellyroll fold domain-containing protein [Bacteroidales bacterium]